MAFFFSIKKASNHDSAKILELTESSCPTEAVTASKQTPAHLYVARKHGVLISADLAAFSRLVTSQNVGLQDNSGKTLLHLELDQPNPSLPFLLFYSNIHSLEVIEIILRHSPDVNILDCDLRYFLCMHLFKHETKISIVLRCHKWEHGYSSYSYRAWSSRPSF